MLNELGCLASIFGFGLQISDLIKKHPKIDEQTAAAMSFVKGLSLKVEQWKKLHVSYHAISHSVNILSFLISDKEGMILCPTSPGKIARETLNNFFLNHQALYHALKNTEPRYRAFFTEIDRDISKLSSTAELNKEDYSAFFEERKFDIDEYRQALLACKQAHDDVCNCFQFLREVAVQNDGWSKDKRAELINRHYKTLTVEFNTIIDNIDMILVWYIDCYISVTKRL